MEAMMADCLKDYKKTYSWKSRGYLCQWINLPKWTGCIPVAFQELQIWPNQRQDNWSSYRNNDCNCEFVG